MASITRESNGRRTIQFVGSDGKRQSIRLGKVPQRAAEAVKVRVEHLVAAQMGGGALEPETARWVAEIDDTLHKRIAAVGLRCPSEVLSLKWEHVDWERSRIRVYSPKTEHHVGKASREIPLFPELRAVLSEALVATDGAEYVVGGNPSGSSPMCGRLAELQSPDPV